MPGKWLPDALADILVTIAATAGAKVERAEVLKAWGLGGRAVETEEDQRMVARLEEWFGR